LARRLCPNSGKTLPMNQTGASDFISAILRFAAFAFMMSQDTVNRAGDP
jgi:hypothetical protein